MASQIVMPKLSDTMEEGLVIRWLKKEGDWIESGDSVVEVETDKAVLELEAYTAGVLKKILIAEGTRVPVGELIGIIADPDEDISPLLEEHRVRVPWSTKAARVEREAAKGETLPASSRVDIEERSVGAPLNVSPLAKRMAEEAGIDLSRIQGSGSGGRIVKEDVEVYLAKVPTQRAPEVAPLVKKEVVREKEIVREEEYEEVDLSILRKTIARRMVQSKGPVPHFYETVEIDMGNVIELRKTLNSLEEGLKISFNDIIIKATAITLKKFPQVNASFVEGEKVRLHRRINIGMAVALEDGLLTPVVPDCDKKSLGEIARQAKDLIERARVRKITPEEYSNSTFTISNLGMYNV
ncbi:MAG: 2-oxo acid dehydrogenase subunit E2, partial [Candidatus Tectomicrobia bacterium]|nr:2-oxo acid dehydrogenase subunit E2 [Candidatus Tectomicrobia bacterium]